MFCLTLESFKSLVQTMTESEICKFYNGKKVFILGGSGFLGKVLIEKLMRTTNISTIYMLLRPKKTRNIHTRVDEIFDSILFQKLKNENPNFKNRIIPINGDCSANNLGLTLKNRQKLIENVNIVFHVAATVRFNENLKVSFNTNVRGTKAVLTLCKQMKHLKSIVYVSTAYSHCYRDNIDEIFYDCPLSYEEVEAKLKKLSLKRAEKLTPKIIGKWPNTYTFSKALAESLIRTYGKTLPVAIVRPSIVISTYREPLEGWNDTFTGATGLYAAIYLGLVRVFQTDGRAVTDIVPVDTCASAMIATAWDIHQQRGEDNITIYNYVSYPENPLTCEEYCEINAIYCAKYPSNSLIWTPCDFIYIKNYFVVSILKFFISYIPGAVMDTAAWLSGQKPQLLKMYKRIHKQTNVFSYFTMRQWKFKNDNMAGLWTKMNDTDKKLFPFSFKIISWTDYFENYVKGIRVYLLKEPLDNLEVAKIKLKRFLFVRKLLIFIIVIFLTIVIFWR